MKHPARQSARPVVRTIAVRAISGRATRGVVQFGGLSIPCALGRGGISAIKREGDGVTPAGRFTFDTVLYRPDRTPRPRTALPVHPLKARDGWCDDPSDRNYNRPVRLPYPASSETMCRSDQLYDLIAVLGYNRRPRIKGRGSAIFMHVAKPGYEPTEGCVALSAKHLRLLLSKLGRRSRIRIIT